MFTYNKGNLYSSWQNEATVLISRQKPDTQQQIW